MTTKHDTNQRPAVTVMTKSNGPITKTISLGSGGKVVSDARGCSMSEGVAERHVLDSTDPHQRLADLINGLTASQAIVLGGYKLSAARVPIVTSGEDKKRVAGRTGGLGKSYLTRTRNCFTFDRGPGVMMLDIDLKDLPDEKRDEVQSVDDVMKILQQAAPGLATVPYVDRASTSSYITNSQTGEAATEIGGYHIYFIVEDATDIPDALKRLQDRLWLIGYGFHRLSGDGKVLKRSLIDVSVGASERLIFEGAPVVIAPLVQDQKARAARVGYPASGSSGRWLDTRREIPVLSASEEAELKRRIDTSAARLKPLGKKQKKAHVTSKGAEVAKSQQISQKAAEKIVLARLRGKLSLADRVEFDDPALGEVSVLEILRNGDLYDEESMSDPSGGGGGAPCKAMFFRNWPDGVPQIHSFCDGGKIYHFDTGVGAAATAVRNGCCPVAVSMACGFEAIELEQFLSALSSEISEEVMCQVRSACTEAAAELRLLRNRQASAEFGPINPTETSDSLGNRLRADELAKRVSDTSEDSIARALAEQLEGQILYDHTVERWFIWHGDHWAEDNTGRVREKIREAARIIYAALGQKQGVSSRAVSGIESLARTDQRLATTNDSWDIDPYLLGAPSVTLDLERGIARQPSPDDRITKMVAAAPAAHPNCPKFLGFLDEAVGGDADVISFLQRFAGYCLTGDTSADKFLFLYGPGGTGKSTFVNILAAVLGPYAKAADMSGFTRSKYERHQEAFARMRGARLVTASETNRGSKLDAAVIKRLSGGDKIAARFMRQNTFEYDFEAKIILMGNYPPEVDAGDDGVRRRLVIVPFNKKPNSPDPKLEDEIKTELPQILRWMLIGASAYCASGLKVPAACTAATDGCLNELDIIGQWLKEAVERCTKASAVSSDLYQSYSAFAEELGEPVMTGSAFGKELNRRGFAPAENVTTNGKSMKVRQGMRLKETASPANDNSKPAAKDEFGPLPRRSAS